MTLILTVAMKLKLNGGSPQLSQMSFLSVWPFGAAPWWAREQGLYASLIINPGCGQPGQVGMGTLLLLLGKLGA